MGLIDTHAHLYADKFLEDRDEMLARAKAVDIEKIALPNIDAASVEKMLDLEDKNPGYCYAMMGIHPCSIKENYEEELAVAEDWLGKRNFIAIGEIGMDLYWDTSFAKEQRAAFRRQIAWAKELKIPFVIHARNAIDECISIVGENQDGNLSGIFHCFDGNAKQAAQIVDQGFLLGLGGILTYKKSSVPEAIANIGLENLVLETDAPYLPPTPYRGKRNESSFMIEVAKKLSELKEEKMEEIVEITTKNAVDLFKF